MCHVINRITGEPIITAGKATGLWYAEGYYPRFGSGKVLSAEGDPLRVMFKPSLFHSEWDAYAQRAKLKYEPAKEAKEKDTPPPKAATAELGARLVDAMRRIGLASVKYAGSAFGSADRFMISLTRHDAAFLTNEFRGWLDTDDDDLEL